MKYTKYIISAILPLALIGGQAHAAFTIEHNPVVVALPKAPADLAKWPLMSIQNQTNVKKVSDLGLGDLANIDASASGQQSGEIAIPVTVAVHVQSPNVLPGSVNVAQNIIGGGTPKFPANNSTAQIKSLMHYQNGEGEFIYREGGGQFAVMYMDGKFRGGEVALMLAAPRGDSNDIMLNSATASSLRAQVPVITVSSVRALNVVTLDVSPTYLPAPAAAAIAMPAATPVMLSRGAGN